MLFKRNIDPSCTYCRRGKQITEETILCQRKGVVSPAGSCTAFRYDPLKRVPASPGHPDFSQLKRGRFPPLILYKGRPHNTVGPAFMYGIGEKIA